MTHSARHRVMVSLFACLLAPSLATAQAQRVSGRVTDQANEPVAGARVEEKDTLNATTTDLEGRYELQVSGPDAVLVFSAPGFRDETRPAADAQAISLTHLVLMDVEVVGTRRADRSAARTPAPIDVIDIAAVTLPSGQLDVNRLLQMAAPSFNATRQSGADGSDHIDPATLRGLGPDQTLVLLNGKRRHQSSLVNIFGTRGRGNTGTDLNAIPAYAIERIEILRDGASAQYGSDAIAGVINVVLKDGADGFNAMIVGGLFNAHPPSQFDVLPNGATDGEQLQAALNYGVRLGADGFFNATGQFLRKGRTNRPADPDVFSIYRRQFGDAEANDAGLFVNARLPLSPRTAFYAFGGASRRYTDAYAWTREADSDRNVTAIYPNGFDPRITSRVNDGSVSAGVRTRAGEWELDLGNTFGVNRFHYVIEGTLNASLLEQSPTSFDAGGFQLIQNTAALHASRLLSSVRSGLNVALGAEYRVDNYRIFAGEEGSWRNYGLVPQTVNGQTVIVDTLGRPGGSQGFPGFRPGNELSENRGNIGAFADLELDVTPRAMIGAAARFENYSDFGAAVTAKLAGRFDLSRHVTLRGSASTGFRAPSLPQVHFNSTFTDIVSGTFIDKVIAASTSPLTRAVGIPPLEEETAVNLSGGLVTRAGPFSATVDVYRVAVDDRIVLTGAFDAEDSQVGGQLAALGVGAAQFFTNALDTRTVGVDVVLDSVHVLRDQVLRWTLAANFNDMQLGAVHTTPELAGREDIYFGEREQAFLRASAPPVRITLGFDHEVGKLQTTVRLLHHGEVTLVDFLGTPDVYRPKQTLDLSATYRVSGRSTITFGAANVLNQYPTQQDTETESGGVWDAVQMGFSGAYYFAKLNVRF